jgi:regulator of cell morphogenesis and NO signaling
MAPIDPERTLGELVVERPRRARIFEELQLDYCCGGGRSLSETAADHGLDGRTLAIALEAAESVPEPNGAERDWREASLTELCDHIVDVHHAFLRRELPRIGDLLAAVSGRHGDTLPSVKELESRFSRLRDDLIEHIDKEEQGAFVLCRRLDGSDAELPDVSPQFAMHEAAHEAVGEALAEIRELAGDYRTEDALCTTHRVLLEALHDLERDLHRHIHEENNVLFPRMQARLDEARAPVGA